ncbi:hypothetical protein [Enterococcus sp. 5H]|uniref:hypothetical protein n=1 Tax=Enterococcus sp. 5H TaxID=1229490 RepID=UPI00230479DD|nr:hypothetical protein [Enterococcus sp. 5H]MDA9470445.1 hypothetical protein [Enterococcus sp. 5H]
MSYIVSDIGAATGAVSGIKSVEVNKGQQVSLGKSNVSSMETGMEVNNQLLPDLANLIECVKEQGNKFPKIAELIAIEDSKIKF